MKIIETTPPQRSFTVEGLTAREVSLIKRGLYRDTFNDNENVVLFQAFEDFANANDIEDLDVEI